MTKSEWLFEQYWKIHNNLNKACELFDAKKMRLLKKNNELVGMSQKRRCIVLGNGPSLKNHDVSLLKDEVVFCVNRFYQSELFDLISPNYYVLLDPCFFSKDSSSFEKIIQIVEERDNIVLFLPVVYEPLVRKRLSDISDKVRYFNCNLYFVDSFDMDYTLSSSMPAMHSVVQQATVIAAAMGFDEIYYLGVEETEVIVYLENMIGESSREMYSFKQGEKELKEAKEYDEKFYLEEQLRGFSRIFHLYRLLYRYLLRRNVRIFNCSGPSLVPEIPRINFESVFNK